MKPGFARPDALKYLGIELNSAAKRGASKEREKEREGGKQRGKGEREGGGQRVREWEGRERGEVGGEGREG